jgi:hypothetical protein
MEEGKSRMQLPCKIQIDAVRYGRQGTASRVSVASVKRQFRSVLRLRILCPDDMVPKDRRMHEVGLILSWLKKFRHSAVFPRYERCFSAFFEQRR